MITEFGKFLRKLRIDNNELLKNMADKLKITSSYLSAIETGKRDVPENWPDELARIYKLSNDEASLIKKAAQNSKSQIKLELNSLAQKDKDLVFSFAREFKNLDDAQKERILLILNKPKK